MTQDEIIEMARQAGLFTHKEVQPEIVAFAKLVAEKALAQEKALQTLHDENERLGLYRDAYAQPEQEPIMMEIFWDGEDAGVKLTQGFIDSHKVLQLDVLIDAKTEIERIYEELLGAKE